MRTAIVGRGSWAHAALLALGWEQRDVDTKDISVLLVEREFIEPMSDSAVAAFVMLEPYLENKPC